jgi:hypothetical protein
MVADPAVLHAKQRKPRRGPSVACVIRWFCNQQASAHPKQWGGRFGQDCGSAERAGYDGISLEPPCGVSTDVSGIRRPDGAALLKPQPKHQPPQKIRSGRATLYKTKFNIGAAPSNHQSRHASPGTEVDNQSSGNLLGEACTNDKGPLGIFSQRALSVTFFERPEQRCVVAEAHRVAYAGSMMT